MPVNIPTPKRTTNALVRPLDDTPSSDLDQGTYQVEGESGALPVDTGQDLAAPPRPASRSHRGPIGPLSAEHHEAIALAGRRRHRIDRAVRVATFNGWTTLAFAVLAIPFTFFSVTALVMGLALATIAWQEFKGRRLLRQLDPKAPQLLGFNQIAFAAILIFYSFWNIYQGWTGPNPYAEHMVHVELASMLGPIDTLQKAITLAVYGTVIVLSILFQGSTALYYFTRAKPLQTYLSQTPDWIRQLHHSMSEPSGENRKASAKTL